MTTVHRSSGEPITRSNGIALLRSSAIVGLVSILSYCLSFANQLLVANCFGTSIRLDVYLVAITVPLLLMTVIGGAFSLSLVPVLVQRRHDHTTYAAFAGGVFFCIVLCAVALPLIACWLTPALIGLVAPTYTAPLRVDAIAMARVAWLTCGCALVSSYLITIHNAAKRFLVPLIATMLPYCGMLFMMLMFADRMGPQALAWGMLFGTVCAIPLLWLTTGTEMHFQAIPVTVWRDIIRVFRRMPLLLLSMLGLAIYPTIDALWATRLGAGNLSYLSYGQRLLGALANAVVLGPMTVILPHLSETIALGNHSDFRQHTWRAVRMLLTVLSVATLISSLLAVPTVSLLFERGLFDRTATLRVAAILPGMCVGVLAMTIAVLLYRAYCAKADIGGIALITVTGATLYFALSGFLSTVWGLQGIVLAYGITWWLILLWAIARLWWGHWREILNHSNVRFLGHLSLALCVCGLCVGAAQMFVVTPALDSGSLGLGLRLAFTAGLGVVSFFSVAGGFFRMDEVLLLARLLPLGKREHILKPPRD
jgi:putative peptidoglycan lipid II flippase